MGCKVSSSLKEYAAAAAGASANGKNQCGCNCHSNGQPDSGHHKGTSLESDGFRHFHDPRIPLKSRQIFLLKRSWKGISRNISETGMNMFLSLFEKNEGAIKFFKGLDSANTSVSDLRDNKMLQNHVKGVMLTIDEAITSMDELDSTINLLMHVGRSHIRFMHFDPNVFLMIEKPFLLAVKDTLGDRYTAHIEDIYSKAITFILNTLVSGFVQQETVGNNNNIPNFLPAIKE